MEKLLNLLNEYDDGEWVDLYEWHIEWEDIIWYNRFWWGYETIDVSRSVIISKRYWFIERLVKKDKIDTFKLLGKWFDTQKWYEREHYHTVSEWNTDLLLMLSNIQNNPIELLITLLR
jgi:hypothetical protein